MDSKEKASEKEASKTQCGGCPIVDLLSGIPALGSRLADLFPREFVEHSVGARREFLLAVRSLIDEALRVQDSRLEAYRARQAERAARTRGPQKVAVE